MSITIPSNFTLGQVYASLQQVDQNLSSDLIKTKTFRFNSSATIKHLLRPGVNDIDNIDGVEWDFEWSYGLRSLVKQGFYKITGNLHERDISGIPTWSADVLFCPNHNHHHKYFKFLANVGPLVNTEAIGFDWRTSEGRLISSRTIGYSNKERFLVGLINHPFYVSQQKYVGGMKQTIWFIY